MSGSLVVDPPDRSRYLDGCRDVIRAARAAPGCVDFHLSADPIEPGRINVHEEWESVDAVEAFRGSGSDDGQSSMIRSASVRQHEVARSIDLS